MLNFIFLIFVAGCYLGYPTSSNLRIWVPQLQYKEVGEIEDSSGDDLEIAKKLFCMIFKEELRERPDKVRCTETKDKVKLNQDYLKGIRCKLKLMTIGQLLLLYKYVCFNLAFVPLQTIFTTVTTIQPKMLPDLKEK